jgi:UDP-N-acetylmuramate dehydrogenase
MNLIEFKNFSLIKYNTLRLKSVAAVCYFPLNMEGLSEAIEKSSSKKRIFLGNGSNVLFTKEFYNEEYVFIITTMMNNIEKNGPEMIVDAGVTLHDLAWFAMDNEIGRYEFCEDIPGTAGGALIMNAGQWQWTISQYVRWVDVIDLNTQETIRIVPEEGFFQYRNSRFNDMNVVIARAGLSVAKGDYREILERMLEFKKERYFKQPRNYPNAGSVFKRPTKNNETYFVWKLFDEVGLRGYQIGGARVSEKHPGFIVNVDHATCYDCVALITECKTRVKDHFDIDLELEWRVIE